ncbi:MAG TPA: insulinase family protein, partial [Chitinophagales bacterium]|nr:insulinase family protein [Chitinophagales bacterium]
MHKLIVYGLLFMTMTTATAQTSGSSSSSGSNSTQSGNTGKPPTASSSSVSSTGQTVGPVRVDPGTPDPFTIFNQTTGASGAQQLDGGKYPYMQVPGDPTRTRIYTLKNGMKVYLSQNKTEPRIQTYIAVRTGSNNDPKETTGLAHYLEHMMFKGTSQIGTTGWDREQMVINGISQLYEKHRKETDPEKKKEIYREIDLMSQEAAKFAVPNEYDKMITSLGAKGTNAYTSKEQTVYVNDIPSNELDKWLLIESERFRTCVLRLFHTEMEAVYEEYNMSQDRDGSKMFEAY